MAQASSRIFAPGLLDGRVCVVSGAGSGLGRAAALELARLGATVVGCGRRLEPLEETVELVGAEGGRCSAHELDIRDADAVGEFFDRVLGEGDRVDVLVNNAGGQFLSPAEAISPKGFRTVMELNVQGTWQMTHSAATKAFIPQRAGRVINVTLSPHQGLPGMSHSGAARAAVENLTRTLATEWARFNIQLVAIAAGHFGTEVIREKYPQAIADNMAGTVPAQRLGEPEELAWLVAYAASPAAEYLSGTVLTIDGGRDNWFGPWPPKGAADDAGEPLAEER
ncbi:MAG: SDR family oxidoreductase [Solirubrobacterales bacterium]